MALMAYMSRHHFAGYFPFHRLFIILLLFIGLFFIIVRVTAKVSSMILSFLFFDYLVLLLQGGLACHCHVFGIFKVDECGFLLEPLRMVHFTPEFVRSLLLPDPINMVEEDLQLGALISSQGLILVLDSP